MTRIRTAVALTVLALWGPACSATDAATGAGAAPAPPVRTFVPPAIPEEAPLGGVDLAAATGDWEVVTPSMVGAPSIEGLSPRAERTLRDAVHAAHVDRGTLAGSPTPWLTRIHAEWGGDPDAVDPGEGLTALMQVTRFAPGWSVSQVRGIGAWQTDITADRAEIAWHGSFAYDLVRGDDRRTVVIGRSWTMVETDVRGTELSWTAAWSGVDVCASHRRGSFVPGDAPSEVPDAVLSPGTAAPEEVQDISGTIAGCEALDGT